MEIPPKPINSKFNYIWRKYIINFLRSNSPCCNKPMESVFEMNLNKLLYTCPNCKKEWI